LGNISHNVGYPEEFVQAIDKTVGFWPGGPDSLQLQAGRIDEATYLEQLERLANYLRDATLLAMKNVEWDLLLTYQPQPDEAQHQFLLLDPRQKGFEDEAKRKRFASYVQSAYQLADKNVKALTDAAGLERTNVFIVSDHGMAPFHTVIELNQILRDNGFVLTCPGVQVRAISSGGQAHSQSL